MGDLESGEDGISLIPCGSGMENGKITRLKCPGRCIRKKPGCGRPVLPSASSEALGQVPGGSGLGVNAEDHGSWPMGWSFLYRIPYRIWSATSHQEVETKIFALKSSELL